MLESEITVPETSTVSGRSKSSRIREQHKVSYDITCLLLQLAFLTHKNDVIRDVLDVLTSTFKSNKEDK